MRPLNSLRFFVIAVILVLFNSVLHAHETTYDGGFIAGLKHPVLGFDHLLAMLSVGILSHQMGGKAIWVVPASFVLFMLIGGILGMKEIPLFSVETGISLSVFFLGLAIALAKKIPVLIAMLFVSFFALFHGHAHGTEMPFLENPKPYALGFLSGTTIIHILGILIAMLIVKLADGKMLLRFIGAGISGVGVHLLYWCWFS